MDELKPGRTQWEWNKRRDNVFFLRGVTKIHR